MASVPCFYDLGLRARPECLTRRSVMRFDKSFLFTRARQLAQRRKTRQERKGLSSPPARIFDGRVTSYTHTRIIIAVGRLWRSIPRPDRSITTCAPDCIASWIDAHVHLNFAFGKRRKESSANDTLRKTLSCGLERTSDADAGFYDRAELGGAPLAWRCVMRSGAKCCPARA